MRYDYCASRGEAVCGVAGIANYQLNSSKNDSKRPENGRAVLGSRGGPDALTSSSKGLQLLFRCLFDC